MNKAARRLVGMTHSIWAWHEATFPEATEETQESKFTEETHEAELEQAKMTDLSTTPTDELMFELADCFITSIGMYRFNGELAGEMLNHLWDGISDKAFILLPDFVERKMAINKKRTWTMDKNGIYHHEEVKTKGV